MGRYRKRPVEVDAIRFSGSNLDEVAAMLGWEAIGPADATCDRIVIETLEGDVTAGIGDWVIRGVAGEGYPCRDDVFRATYEPVDGASF